MNRQWLKTIGALLLIGILLLAWLVFVFMVTGLDGLMVGVAAVVTTCMLTVGLNLLFEV